MGQPLAFVQPVPQFRFYTPDALAALPPAEWLVEDIFEADSQVVLYGYSGDGKSFVTLDLALSIATGQSWHGHKVKQGPVFYIAGEGGPGLSRRIEAWCDINHITKLRDVLISMDAPQLADPKSVAAFIAAIRGQTRPVLIVLDTFARTFVGMDENTSKDTGLWIAGAKTLQEAFGCTVLAVHHTGKNKKDERGSGAIRGAMNTMIRVVKSGNAITVSCDKQKDDEEFDPLGLTLTEAPLAGGKPSCALTDGAVPGLGNAGLTLNSRRLLAALASCGPGPTAVAVWHEALNEDGQGAVSDTSFRRWKKDCEPDYVHCIKKGFYQLTPMGTTATAKQPPLTATAVDPPTATTATTP